MVVARLVVRYLSQVRWLPLLLTIAACKSGSSPKGADEVTYAAPLAGDLESEPAPSYGKAEIQKALIAERAAEARGEREVGELEAGEPDRLSMAMADLAVRRRFIAILELCEQQGRMCPPRLDDPPWSYTVESEGDPKLDVPLRFDVDSWQKVSAELHGRSCACRTLACVDSLEVAIAKLEVRPMPDVQSDDKAMLSITRARECLFRLRGKRDLPRVEP